VVFQGSAGSLEIYPLVNIAILWTFVGFGLLFPEHVLVLGHVGSCLLILDGFLSGTLVEWNWCCPFTISNAVTQAHIGNGPKLCTPKVGWLKNKTQNIQNSVSPHFWTCRPSTFLTLCSLDVEFRSWRNCWEPCWWLKVQYLRI
jgi:hypothetical protein